MAAAQPASRANFYIDYSGGNKLLRRVKSADPKDERSTEAVTACVDGDDAIGFRRKPGGRTIALEAYQEQGGNPEVDWESLAETQEPFAFTIQVIGGRRRQWRPCVVSKVEPKDNDQGEHMQSIELVCLGSVTTS